MVKHDVKVTNGHQSQVHDSHLGLPQKAVGHLGLGSNVHFDYQLDLYISISIHQ